jgi:hypothetical protein
VTWGLYVFAFVVLFVTDLVWVGYMSAVKDKKPWLAAVSAALLYVAGGLATLAYIDDPGVLVAGGLGAFAGTALGVAIKGDGRAQEHEESGV